MKRPPRPTVHDVAKEAGVSLATVDRVLNERPGVSAKTHERVQKAIKKIGFVRDVAAANLARQRDYRFSFVLPHPSNAFLTTIHEALREASRAFVLDRTLIEIHPTPAHDPHAVAHTLDALDTELVDGLAVLAAETPQVRDALKRFSAAGVPIASVVTDLPSAHRDHFVGINNVAAGRVAGELMGRFLGGRSGKIIVLAGSMMSRDHVERRLGFDQVIAASFPQLEVLGSIECWDDADIVERVLPPALERTSGVLGIYSIGGGNSGLVKVLERRGGAEALQVIVHELTPAARDALCDGIFDAVITQDVRHIVRSAIRLLRASCDERDVVASQERIRIEIVLRENLD